MSLRPWLRFGLVALAFAAVLSWPLPNLQDPPQNPSLRQTWSYLPAPQREALVERFLLVKASAALLIGQEGAGALARVLRAEFLNQALRRPSTYADPEAALGEAENWLRALYALKHGQYPDLKGLPVALEHVLPFQLDLTNAAAAIGVPKGILAAIVDNEQMGGDKALGLSRGVREVADQIAANLAKSTGTSGGAGAVSHTVGLAQMSWQDALRQEARIRAFGAWDPEQPFLQNEEEARAALTNPYLNFLLTASRLRGYLNSKLGLDSDDTRTISGYWLYYLGPAWHNWPPGADAVATWPYAFHGFFKGLFYESLLSIK
ncbi:MAG: hypothetical protein C4331_16550 [Meiothermus sp.]